MPQIPEYGFRGGVETFLEQFNKGREFREKMAERKEERERKKEEEARRERESKTEEFKAFGAPLSSIERGRELSLRPEFSEKTIPERMARRQGEIGPVEVPISPEARQSVTEFRSFQERLSSKGKPRGVDRLPTGTLRQIVKDLQDRKSKALQPGDFSEEDEALLQAGTDEIQRRVPGFREPTKSAAPAPTEKPGFFSRLVSGLSQAGGALGKSPAKSPEEETRRKLGLGPRR